MFGIASLRREWFSILRGDVLAGIVVALALIPEAIGFSIIAGVDPRVGLYAAFSIAVVTALVGGRPGMISAATAAVAVLVVPLVRAHGVEYLFAATILLGIIQIAAGFLRIDLLMQFVSRSITGFVNALAILMQMQAMALAAQRRRAAERQRIEAALTTPACHCASRAPRVSERSQRVVRQSIPTVTNL